MDLLICFISVRSYVLWMLYCYKLQMLCAMSLFAVIYINYRCQVEVSAMPCAAYIEPLLCYCSLHIFIEILSISFTHQPSNPLCSSSPLFLLPPSPDCVPRSLAEPQCTLHNRLLLCRIPCCAHWAGCPGVLVCKILCCAEYPTLLCSLSRIPWCARLQNTLSCRIPCCAHWAGCPGVLVSKKYSVVRLVGILCGGTLEYC